MAQAGGGDAAGRVVASRLSFAVAGSPVAGRRRLSSLERMSDSPDEIVRLALSKPCTGATRLVAIDGLGGAGKTTLAAEIAKRTGGHVVHLDEIATWPDGPDLVRLEREVVAPLTAGIDATYRVWDWASMQLGGWRSAPASGVVIIEGSGSTSLEVADALTFTIWVDCPEDVRLERTLARDGEQVRGAWTHWTEWEGRYLARQGPRHRVDLVVDCVAALDLSPEAGAGPPMPQP